MTWEDFTDLQVKWMNDEAGQLDDGFDCAVCKNRGFTFHSDGKGIYTKECNCMARRYTARRAKRSGCADLLKVFNFGNYKTDTDWRKDISSKAKEFSKCDRGVFYIGGQVGSGKTHICTAIVNALIERGKECRYVVWRDMLTRINSTVDNSELFEATIDEYVQTEVLYIDDFFKTSPSAAEIDKAFRVINGRYNKYLGGAKTFTIISAEKTLSQLVAIDEAVASRLKQIAGDYFVSVKHDPQRNYRLYGK
ncbi:MAG: ATP-binding protein [Corallococcus sp.]|nr:ATP-binding protein [Corallococcus sp.]